MYTTTKRTRIEDVDYRSISRSSSTSPTPTTKAIRLSPSRESPLSSTEGAPLLCTLPPTCHPPHNAPTRLANSNELETHYAKYHAFVCEEHGCNAVFPNARLLELHQTECHDPLASVRKERGEKIFACHLESCVRLFLDPKKRRLHLIQAHGYPKEYFFAVTNKGVGGLLKKWGDGASMIRKPWKRRDDNEGMEVEGSDSSDDNDVGSPGTVIAQVINTVNKSDTGREQAGHHDDIDAIANSLDSLSLVPSTIRFGRGGKRKTLVQTAAHTDTQKINSKDADSRPTESNGSGESGSVSINIDGALEALKAEISRPRVTRQPEREASNVRGRPPVHALGGGRGRGSGRARIGGRGRGRGGPPRGRGQA